jgi:hypothetical protein
MSLAMTLELDAQINRDSVKSLLMTSNVMQVTETRERLTGNFPVSNMFFIFRDDNDQPSNVLTEGVQGITWPVGARMTFEFVTANYDKCSAQLRQFLEDLTELSPAYFVLSFQYERAYAIRDERGMRLLQKF